MRRKLVTAMVVGLLAAAGSSVQVVSGSAGAQQGGNITICHATNANPNSNNPYNAITVDDDAIDGVGGNDHFGQHTGPLLTSLAQWEVFKDNHIDWGDIIPPLPGVHGGLNWPEGQAILENGCAFPGPPPPPSSTTPPPSTTPAPGQVTICHATHADPNSNNPYNEITVSESAVDGVGGGDHFGEHTGPLLTSLAQWEVFKDNNIDWGDIIPPLAGVHGGLNWPEGQAILLAGCEFPPTPPPSTAGPTTTRRPTTTTRAPSTTTRAPAPPTTRAPAPPTTKAPAPPTTKAPAPPTTKAPVTTTTRPIQVIPPRPGAPLAFTGTETGKIALVAFFMLAFGLMLLARNHRSPPLLTVDSSGRSARVDPAHRTTTTTLETPIEQAPDGPAAQIGEESSFESLWPEVHAALEALDAWLASTKPDEDETSGDH